MPFVKPASGSTAPPSVILRQGLSWKVSDTTSLPNVFHRGDVKGIVFWPLAVVVISSRQATRYFIQWRTFKFVPPKLRYDCHNRCSKRFQIYSKRAVRAGGTFIARVSCVFLR